MLKYKSNSKKLNPQSITNNKLSNFQCYQEFAQKKQSFTKIQERKKDSIRIAILLFGSLIFLWVFIFSLQMKLKPSMLKEKITLKQFPQQISIQNPSNSRQQLSYSRHLSMKFNSSMPEVKQTNHQSQQSTVILRPSWNNLFKAELTNRKDEMLKILKGKNYRLQVVKKKSSPDLQSWQIQNKKSEPVRNNSQNQVMKKVKRTSEAQRAAVCKIQSNKRKWLQNERKFLVKTLRLQKLIDVQRVHYL